MEEGREYGNPDDVGEEEEGEEEEVEEEEAEVEDTFSEEEDIEDLFNKNTESFRCLMQILLSRSSLLRHILYNYPDLKDPGIDDAFNYVEPELVYDNIGIEKYKNLCKDYNIIPLSRVIKSLPTDTLDLKFYGLTMLEVKTISTTLMLNAHIKSLILEDNWMTPEATFYIGEALRENNSIDVLSLKECRIGPEGAKNLIEGLSLNQSLRELDLSFNDLGDEGLLYIIEALKENQQVRKLNLGHNHLGDVAGKALGSYLKENSSTDYLDLSWNDFRTVPGLKDLCNGLVANKSVTYLNLSWNGIATEGALAPIYKYMRLSNNLQHLNLSSNRLMTPLLETVRLGMVKSKSLVSIKLGGNLITADDAEFLVAPLLILGKPLKYIDLENVFVNRSFVPTWKRITSRGKSVRIEGVLDNYVIKGPNEFRVIFERCKYLAQKPKKKKQKRDFGTFIYTLPDEILDVKEIQARIRKYKMKKIDADLIAGLCDLFRAKKGVNTPLLKETYLNMYPDTERPPPPKPKKDRKGRMKKAKIEPTPAPIGVEEDTTERKEEPTPAPIGEETELEKPTAEKEEPTPAPIDKEADTEKPTTEGVAGEITEPTEETVTPPPDVAAELPPPEETAAVQPEDAETPVKKKSESRRVTLVGSVNTSKSSMPSGLKISASANEAEKFEEPGGLTETNPEAVDGAVEK